ncbi:hypothetical protein, partial [Photobacterium sp. R1]
MNQSVNIGYGDCSTHNGDNVFVQLTALEQAVEQIKKRLGSNTDAIDIIEDLADYITDYPSR